MNSVSETVSRIPLIVDDDVYVINSLVRLLRPYFDHILTATDTERAMEILQSSQVAVVISEMFSHPVDTIALFRKAKHEWPSTITVLLTRKNDVSDILRENRKGIIDVFLPKPWANAELVAAVFLSP